MSSERELTGPVDLCDQRGRLNPEARGWSRQPMLRANLYEFGRDLNSDRAIALFPALDNFVATRKAEGIEGSFKELRSILEPKPASNPAPPVAVTMVKR